MFGYSDGEEGCGDKGGEADGNVEFGGAAMRAECGEEEEAEEWEGEDGDQRHACPLWWAPVEQQKSAKG